MAGMVFSFQQHIPRTRFPRKQGVLYWALSGTYSFSHEERKTIIERALSLSIKDYWKGLLSFRNDIEWNT